MNFAASPQKTGTIGFVFELPHDRALDGHVMGRPDFRLGAGAPPPGRQQHAQIGRELGLDEQLRECGMSRIGRRRRQRELAVRGDIEIDCAVARIRNRHASDLGVVLRGYDDLEGRDDCRVDADEFRPVLAECDFITVGFVRRTAGKPADHTAPLAASRTNT